MTDKSYDSFDDLPPFPEEEITFSSQADQEPESLDQGYGDDSAVKAEITEIRLRALAEMENFKKRLQKEKEEQILYASEKVLADLLPTLDNFDLALQYGSQSEECKNIVMGVEMTRKIMLDTLKNHGLIQLGQVGELFDPNLHEAFGQEKSAEVGPGCIIKVMLKGYKLRERLLRPAKVIVNSAEAKKVNRKV